MAEDTVKPASGEGEAGSMKGDRGDAKAQPSGPRGDNPATAGRGETKVNSSTAENAEGELNPSAPGETGTTEKKQGRDGGPTRT